MTAEDELPRNLEHALRYWILGIQYLHLAQSVAEMISEAGNPQALCYDGNDWDEIDRRFRKATNWTDYNLGVPVIFNFYHGIELILKGLLVATDQGSKNHKITAQLQTVKESCGKEDFLDFAGKYLSPETVPEIIKRFIDLSEANIDEWYQAYKYPDNITGDKQYLHHTLMRQGEDGAALFAELKEDIKNLRVAFVAYARGKYPALR